MTDRLLLLCILLSLFCFSCVKQEKKESAASQNILENLTVTFDTVRVDMGGEVLMADAYESFALSPDASRIFFEYGEKLEIHEIDLYQMRLVKRHALADDGPDRAPNYVKGFQWVPENRFFIFSQSTAGIYDLNGKKWKPLPTSFLKFPVWLGKMVNYKELLFDSSRQLYFRLATQNANYNADHKRLGEEVWLLSYDVNFKLIGEQQIKEITWAPWNPFFKDGALFGYAVLDEDPALGVMDLKF